MYEKIKKIAKAIVPKAIIDKNEEKLRSLIALKYRGNSVYCNVCSSSFSSFIKLDNGELLCPKCGCLPRTRRLYSLIEKEPNLPTKSLLHFSPPKALRKKLKTLPLKEYITTDYEGEFKADKKYNIQQIEQEDDTYDLIICYHVLEHIPNDQKAMNELFRVLKPSGKCFIQTPFKDGEIYEDDTITTPEGRTQHFGQHDHLRIYSVKGLTQRLKNAGFVVKVNQYPEDYKLGYKHETVIEAVKP